MRYLVKARVKPARKEPLLKAIESGTLGRGSIAGDEYVYDMEQARLNEDGDGASQVLGITRMNSDLSM